MDPGEKTGTTLIRLRDRRKRGGGDERGKRSVEEGERPGRSWPREPVRRRRGGRRWGAFTEEAPSRWRSPPRPRLSAQTQTAPGEGKKGGNSRGREKEGFRNVISE